MDGVSIIVTYLINAVWLVTVVAAAGWLATLCLKRLGPQAEHIGWVVTLEIAIVAPAAPLLRQLPVLSGNQLFNVGHSSTVTVTATYASAGFGGLYQLPVPALWTITALYFAVVLFCATRFAWLLYATRRMVENAHPLELTPEQKENWNRCKHLFEVDRILLASSAAIHAPVVLELREAILVLPDGFAERCTLPDLMTALAHECAHASRRDFKKNLCYEAMGLVLAFHPAAWAIKAQIAQTREMVCDRMVAERVLDPRAYAKLLLRLAAMVANSSRSATAHAIGIFDANILEKRIMMMNRTIRRAGVATRYGLTISAVLLLASTWIVAAAKAVVIEPLSPSAADQVKSHGTVYKIGKDVSAPVLIHSVDAEFPRSGQPIKAPFSAIVLVRLIVDKDGMPQDVHISRSYNPDFDREAIDAVKQYRFKPAMREGAPVAVVVTIEANFKKY